MANDVNTQIPTNPPIKIGYYMGPPGLSAYELAVKNGFTGSEEDFLQRPIQVIDIPLTGYVFEHEINKYVQAIVVDENDEEVSVVMRHHDGKIVINSIVPLDNHMLRISTIGEQ